jgi:PAS domain S-box-containing protein
VDLSPVGITVFDRQGRIVFANALVQEVARRMGIPAIEGWAYDDPAWKLTTEAGIPLPAEALPFAQVLNSGQPISDFCYAFELPDGQRFHLSSHAAPLFDSSGAIEGVVVTIEDITARVQAEANLRESARRYQQLLDALQEGIWEVDREAYTSFVNPRMAEMLGYSAEEMLGRHLFSFMDEAGIKICKRNLERRRLGIYEQHDFEFLRKDGSRLYVSMATSALYDEEGNYTGALAGVQDITERVQAEERLEEAAAAAERERLARDLHDAVTQSLFSVAAIAEALPSVWERDRAEGQRGLEDLRRLTQGALAEMRSLLLELRPSALTEHKLEVLLHQLTEAMTSRTRIPVIAQVTGDCTLPAPVRLTLYRITQEALNNVVKHARATQAAVDLHCRPGYARLQICDDGRGFDPEAIQPDRLGLTIMRERAQAIAATLRIKSQPGQGTQVLVEWQGSPEGQKNG